MIVLDLARSAASDKIGSFIHQCILGPGDCLVNWVCRTTTQEWVVKLRVERFK